MNNWNKFDETSLPNKKDFYSSLNMEKELQRLMSMLKKYLKILKWIILAMIVIYMFEVIHYEIDPAHFLSAPGLARQACLKKTEIKLELLTDIDMLLMVEKRIREGKCHAMPICAEANNKYKKNYHKNKES